MTVRRTLSSRAKVIPGCGIAAIVIVVLAGIAIAVLHFVLDAFLVMDGVYCEGCIHRQRACVGVLHETDMLDGQRVRCIGVPIGPWYCFKEVRDERQHRYVPIACPQ